MCGGTLSKWFVRPSSNFFADHYGQTYLIPNDNGLWLPRSPCLEIQRSNVLVQKVEQKVRFFGFEAYNLASNGWAHVQNWFSGNLADHLTLHEIVKL